MTNAMKWALEKIYSMKCWIIMNLAYLGNEITFNSFPFFLNFGSLTDGSSINQDQKKY